MLPLLALLLLLAGSPPAAAQTVPAPDATAEPAISAQAAILVDLTNERVLFSREPHARRAVASLTKVMTAAVALQYGRLADEVVIEGRDLPGEASIGLKAGDRLSLETLLYGMMMRSGNDAAAAIARGVGERVVAERGLRGGGSAVFMDLMNQRAVDLGMLNTHFVNPHGLDAPGHVSSAYDLALLTRAALRDATFARIFGARTYPYNGSAWTNANRLLYSYEPLIGGKTGVTDDAGLCLVEVAQRGDRRLLVVVLDSPHWYADAQALLEYGFSQDRALAGSVPFGAAGTLTGPPFLTTTAPPAATLVAQAPTATRSVSATQRVLPVATPAAAAVRATVAGGSGGSGDSAGPAPRPASQPPAAPLDEGALPGALVATQTSGEAGGIWLPLGLGLLAVMLVLVLGGLWLRMTGLRPLGQRRASFEGERAAPAWRVYEAPAASPEEEPAEVDEPDEVDRAQATGRLDDLVAEEDEDEDEDEAAAESPAAPPPNAPSEVDELAAAHLAVAVRYVGEGRIDSAESAFVKAIQIAPDFRFSTVPIFWSMGPDGYVALASAYQRCNRMADARATVALGLITFGEHPGLKMLDDRGQRERRSTRGATGD